MCVIIITNPDNPIDREELSAAWDTNPDGAGLAYVDEGSVKFQRGFMNKSHYLDTVQELQTGRPLLLHLRISTGAGVTPQGTHPYKAGNVLKMKGKTQEPVLAMNGTIRGQALRTKAGAYLNDTASYLWEHQDAFHQVSEALLDIVSQATGAKWAAVTPGGILTGGEFEEHEGRQYSNLNHLWLYDYYAPRDGLLAWYEETPAKNRRQYLFLKDLIPKYLYRQVKRDWLLLDDLEEFVWHHCNKPDCHRCPGHCLGDCETLQDLQEFLHLQEDVPTLEDLETLAGGGRF